ncbi:hypothetical protein OsccyDRAFT_3372 [Leptolyngbyaceae cyanobacterium JSC-12]|nr:hypothetical protein OsccyDRAFT_3372 [Leptolyngbyaceae cyanobacterium JSC-12]
MMWELSLIHPFQVAASFPKGDLLPLGDRKTVVTTLSRLYPTFRFPAYPKFPNIGTIIEEDYHLDFHIPDSELIVMVGIDVYEGDKATVLKLLRPLCESTQWHLLDLIHGELIDVG